MLRRRWLVIITLINQLIFIREKNLVANIFINQTKHVLIKKCIGIGYESVRLSLVLPMVLEEDLSNGFGFSIYLDRQSHC